MLTRRTLLVLLASLVGVSVITSAAAPQMGIEDVRPGMVAGITPSAEMTDSPNFGDLRPIGSKVKVEYPLTRDGLTAAFRKALNWNHPFAARPDDAQLSGATAVAGIGPGQLGTLLRPI